MEGYLGGIEQFSAVQPGYNPPNGPKGKIGLLQLRVLKCLVKSGAGEAKGISNYW